MGTAEIYALTCPYTGEVRYIGKANNSECRFKGHIRDSRRRNTPVYCWIRKILQDGHAPGLKVLETVSSSNWKEAERRLIAEYKSEGRLLNLADGGDEPFCSKQVRAKNAKSNAMLRVSTPEKARLYHLKREMGVLLKRGFVSGATKAKLRRAAYKRPDLFGAWLAV